MPLTKINLADYLSDVFIETGTHRGDGVRRALEAGFRAVFSCEPDVAMLSRMPSSLLLDGKVNIGVGISTKWLPVFIDIAVSVYRAHRVSTTFWLDAHNDGMLGLYDSPLSAELSIIADRLFYMGDVTILVDDMRLFSAEDQQRIEDMVLGMRPEATIFRADGHCENDILVGQM